MSYPSAPEIVRTTERFGAPARFSTVPVASAGWSAAFEPVTRQQKHVARRVRYSPVMVRPRTYSDRALAYGLSRDDSLALSRYFGSQHQPHRVRLSCTEL